MAALITLAAIGLFAAGVIAGIIGLVSVAIPPGGENLTLTREASDNVTRGAEPWSPPCRKPNRLAPHLAPRPLIRDHNMLLTCAPSSALSRIRTCDPLLRRHFRAVAGQCQAWPGVLSSCTDSGRMWPGVAPCLPPLAPLLAPRNLVSPANVRMIERSDDSRKTKFRVIWSVDTSATSGSRWSECSCRTRCRSPVPPSRWWSLSG